MAAEEEGASSLLVQNLSPHTHQDALELHIEAVTECDVINVEYRYGRTEAIVRLDRSIKGDSRYDSGRRVTISGEVVNIVHMKREKSGITSKQEHAGDEHVVNDKVSVSTTCLTDQNQITEVVTYPPDKVDLLEKNDITSKQEHAGDKHVDENKVSIPMRCPTDESLITEVVTCPPEKACLLEMLLPGLQSSLPNCSLKRVPQGIALTATLECVTRARLAVAEQVFTFVSHAISYVPSQRVRLLMSDRGQQFVQELFSTEGIQAVVSVTEDQLWLTATDSYKKSAASKTLEKNIHSFEIPVVDIHHEFLQSAGCKQLIEDLENKYVVTVEQEQSALVIEAMGDCGDDAMAVLREALDANAQQTEDILLAEDDWKLLTNHCKLDVNALGWNRATSAKTTYVRMGQSSEKKGFLIRISGHETVLKDVKTAVKEMEGRIIHQTVKFSIPGLYTYVCEGKVASKISDIQKKYKCQTSVCEERQNTVEREEEFRGEVFGGQEFGDVEFGNETYGEMAEDRCISRARMPNLMVEVRRDDLTQFTADVLVNTPAGKNEDLTKCGRLSGAFCKAAGPEMQQLYAEADHTWRGVRMTRSCGNLQCEHVFHMRLHPLGANYSYEILEDQIYRCLQKASELQADSIAFPTVGCGKLGYDPRSVAQCFKRAVDRHASNDSCHISKVVIAAFDDKMERPFRQLFSVENCSRQPSAKYQQFADQRRQKQTTRQYRSPVRDRRPQPGHSCTVFHVSALEQLMADRSVDAINKIVKEYSAVEKIQDEYLHKLSCEEIVDITALSCEDVGVCVDTRAKCVLVEGAKRALKKVTAQVKEKLLETEERRIQDDRPAYLKYIAKKPVKIPIYWMKVRDLRVKTALRVQTTKAVADAIKQLVQFTWSRKLVGHGQDAANLTHSVISVVDVEQIENSRLHQMYGHTVRSLCGRAPPVGFTKVSCNPNEIDVKTSMGRVSALDDQLIPEINEYFLFHGTRPEYVDGIVQGGIDCQRGQGGMFGQGAYFCEMSTKADQYADDKNSRTSRNHYMFLFKVILGHSYIARQPDNNLKRPPCVKHCPNGKCWHKQIYHSVMGTHRHSTNSTNPTTPLLFREFVIFERCQTYPAYLITYTRK